MTSEVIPLSTHSIKYNFNLKALQCYGIRSHSLYSGYVRLGGVLFPFILVFSSIAEQDHYHLSFSPLLSNLLSLTAGKSTFYLRVAHISGFASRCLDYDLRDVRCHGQTDP
jgi:hypothetical protein